MDPEGVADRVADLAGRLRTEARRADERRLLVCAGSREATYDAARAALAGAGLDPAGVTLLGDRDDLLADGEAPVGERLGPNESARLLGTTREAVVLDAHDRLVPNALGRAVGAVDGGGLLLLLTPPLSEWPDRTDGFDRTLAVVPHDPDAVTGHFRRRVVDTLRAHPGVAIVDADSGRVERDGLTDPLPRPPREPIDPPDRGSFPAAAYERCLTADQASAVEAFEPFHPHADGAVGDGGSNGSGSPDPRAVVLEADRGRGKSSAAGLAAGCLALAGESVLVTAPAVDNAREVFARARELLDGVGNLTGSPPGPGEDGEGSGGAGEGPDGDGKLPRSVASTTGGEVRFRPPGEAVEHVEAADAVIVDEAAALPVERLAATLSADRVAYATTVHGYEGAGRGFSVRFRDRLADSRHQVTDVHLAEPIRYAPGDPVETWAFRALLLDARPPVDPLVEEATPGTVEYRALPPEELVADEHLLREAFGLLVLAHYRTEPDDLARLLDAPNVTVRALCQEGHVVSVALLAREGGLPPEVRAETYEGARIRGHMLPDVLTSQLRDEAAGVPVGLRVMRIATHHAVRSRGLGSHLLGAIREEFAPDGEGGSDPGDAAGSDDGQREDAGSGGDGTGSGDGSGIDWLGVGYGATPELLRFWRANGYRAVHCSVTRNERSGEHSAIMLHPLTPAGEALAGRHARWFADRAPAMLTDPLRELDPDVVRELLRSVGVERDPDLTDHEWRHVAAAAGGPGLFETDPGPFRRLVVAHLVDPADPGALTADQERLLVRAVLQARPIPETVAALGFHGTGECLRAVGAALGTLVDLYGTAAAREERERHG